MARVRFTDDFDYRPSYGTTIAYSSGMKLTVRRECADQAIAAGKAVDLEKPRRPSKATTMPEAANGAA